MAGTQGTLKIGGMTIPPEERTPLVDHLVRMLQDLQQENEKLRDEINRLKGLPEIPRRPPQPSTLNDPQGKPSRVLVIEGRAAWEQQLDRWKIRAPEVCRLVSEAALFGSRMDHDLYMHQPLISDDAAQFKVLGLMIGLQDRIHGLNTIPSLGDLIREKATATSSTCC